MELLAIMILGLIRSKNKETVGNIGHAAVSHGDVRGATAWVHWVAIVGKDGPSWCNPWEHSGGNHLTTCKWMGAGHRLDLQGQYATADNRGCNHTAWHPVRRGGGHYNSYH
eukprot:156048-Ditylum_brightwellii.AAC.1